LIDFENQSPGARTMSDPNREEGLEQPYASPFGMTPVYPAGMGTAPVSRRRTGGLTAICVLAIVLGAMGVLTGCFGLVGLLFSSQMQNAIAGIQQANQGAAEVQNEMNAKALTISRKYSWATVPLMVAKLFVEIALLAGAIMSLGLKPLGRRMLLAAFGAAIVVESIQLVPALLVQRETQALMAEMMPKMMQEVQQGAKKTPGFDPDQFASGLVKAISIMSFVIGIGWLVCKVVYYAIGIVYLRKPQVAASFVPQPPRDPLEWR
jgi:hypothetical protein